MKNTTSITPPLTAGAPRSALAVRMIEQTARVARATYDKHEIYGSRDYAYLDWYIQVFAPDGSYSYDGWWKESADKSAPEVVEEAMRGACLVPPPELHFYRWWYKGRAPDGVIAEFTGSVSAHSEHDAMNVVEKMMREKHPDIVWMRGKELEGNGLHYGPTIQMRKVPPARFATVRCEGDRWDGKRVQIMSGPKGDVWQVRANKEIRAVFTEHLELKQNNPILPQTGR